MSTLFRKPDTEELLKIMLKAGYPLDIKQDSFYGVSVAPHDFTISPKRVFTNRGLFQNYVWSNREPYLKKITSP